MEAEQTSGQPEAASPQSPAEPAGEESSNAAAGPKSANSDVAADDTLASSKADDTIKTSTTNNADDEAPISKNQLKKRRRYEKALAIKKRRKDQEREIRHLKAQQAGRDLERERQIQRENEQSRRGWKIREEKWKKVMIDADIENSFRVCFDCSFEGLMTRKELGSLGLQLRYTYAINRKSRMPVFIDLSSFKAGCETRSHLDKVKGFPDSWVGRAFRCHEDGLEELYGCKQEVNDEDKATIKKENVDDDRYKTTSDEGKEVMVGGNTTHDTNKAKNIATQEFIVTNSPLNLPLNHKLVYLTGDSTNTLTTLQNNTTYIIGGIVDRNRHKHVTAKRAKSLGIPTARLPLEENLNFNGKTRILTCNHVFEILLKFRDGGCKDWKEAIVAVLPTRKGYDDVTVGEKDDAYEDDEVGNDRKEDLQVKTNDSEIHYLKD
mmetsp:Transcript_25163/g.51895  ORF Transcript_25163/g.51895 Transcript_25163/m.51895 type:complete len:435 (-) Transcript_25163:1836-3140(-)